MGSYGTNSTWNKKKIAAVGICSVLLLAAIVGTITYGATKNDTDQTDDSPSGNTGQASNTSSKAIEAICQPTDYKQTCEKSLAGAQNTSDPKELIKVVFQVAVQSVEEVIANSSLLKAAAKDPRTSQAFDICKEVLETSIDDLKRSFDKIGSFDVSKFDDCVADLKTWISGAITYQDTCLEAFKNTTGDTGEKMQKLMKTTRELSSNGLAMVSEIAQVISSLQIPGFSRRLLSSEQDEYPRGIGEADADTHRYLQAKPSDIKPNAIVAQDGSGQFKTITDAVKTVPKWNKKTFVILVKAGVYKEYVQIPRHVDNIFLLGEGPTKTKITGSKNYADGTAIYNTATVAVDGDNFIARDIGFENTAGAMKHQAVALRVSGDKAVFYNCHIDGYQDTLNALNYRQYYRDCTISGTIDVIFGDAAAVFQNCKLIVKKPLDDQDCTVTAEGRTDPRGTGGIILQNCTITADQDFVAAKPAHRAFLGRPWQEYSRTLVIQSFIDGMIDPEGWTPWAGTYGIDTCYYGEFGNRGPGSKTNQRVKWKGIQKITPQIAQSFTPGVFIQGDGWIPGTGFPYESGLMKV